MKPILPVELEVGTLAGSYRALANAFIAFATKKKSPIHGAGPNKVYFLGTYWDQHPDTGKDIAVQVNHGTHLFINPVIAIVSAEEHPEEFPPNPTDKQVMGRTEEIINDTDVEITIREPDGKTSDFSVGQLQRIQVPFRKRQQLKIDSDVWPKYPRGGTANACWDGYFLAFEDLQNGKHEIELEADSPYFGRPGHRYRSSLHYELTVS